MVAPGHFRRALQIGFPYPLKKCLRLLLKPVKLTALSSTSHTGFHRRIQQNNVVRTHLTLNQSLKQRNPFSGNATTTP